MWYNGRNNQIFCRLVRIVNFGIEANSDFDLINSIWIYYVCHILLEYGHICHDPTNLRNIYIDWNEACENAILFSSKDVTIECK